MEAVDLAVNVIEYPPPVRGQQTASEEEWGDWGSGAVSKIREVSP